MKIIFFGDSLVEGRPGVSFLEILKKKLPGHTLINCGRGGDTVVSLYQRIARLNLNENFDMAFLWVGVNDIWVKMSPSFPVIKAMMGQTWAENEQEFKEYYKSALTIICQVADVVVTVPPLFIGEDLDNEWNNKLEELAKVIVELSAVCGNAEYLDLRKAFLEQLKEEVSGYLPKSSAQVALDALMRRSNQQVNGTASSRGLHFTLDGVHLNSIGAEIVAQVFKETIHRLSGDVQTT